MPPGRRRVAGPAPTSTSLLALAVWRLLGCFTPSSPRLGVECYSSRVCCCSPPCMLLPAHRCAGSWACPGWGPAACRGSGTTGTAPAEHPPAGRPAAAGAGTATGECELAVYSAGQPAGCRLQWPCCKKEGCRQLVRAISTACSSLRAGRLRKPTTRRLRPLRRLQTDLIASTASVPAAPSATFSRSRPEVLAWSSVGLGAMYADEVLNDWTIVPADGRNDVQSQHLACAAVAAGTAALEGLHTGGQSCLSRFSRLEPAFLLLILSSGAGASRVPGATACLSPCVTTPHATWVGECVA